MENKFHVGISKELFVAMQQIVANRGKVFMMVEDANCTSEPGKFDVYTATMSIAQQSQPKPRTKVEYEKVEFDHVWEAVKAFEDGNELHTHFKVDGFVPVEGVQQVVPNFQVGKLYRRIETEIDWSEDVMEIVPQGYGVTKCGARDIQISGIYNKEQAKILAESILKAIS